MYLDDDNVEELNSELELSCIRNLLLEIIKNNVNVNIKMYKKWKIKMYNLGSTIHQLSYHQ